MTINFHHGILCDEYEKQANAQGYTFGDRADFVQDVAFGINAAFIHGCISESEYDKIMQRFQQKILMKFLRAEKRDPEKEYKIGKLYLEGFLGGYKGALNRTEAENV